MDSRAMASRKLYQRCCS